MMMSLPHRNRKNILIFAAAFGVIGSVLLLRSFASSPAISFEAENASLSGAATLGSDANASGGKFVQLGTSQITPPVTPPPSTSGVTLPTRAAFYYPWFPETWVVNGVHVAYNPLLGYYDSSQQAVVDSHIKALDYAKINVAIASWWGPNTHNETTRLPLLMQRTQALSSPLKWTLYYEIEGTSDPSVTQIQSDLKYIKANYSTNPSFARVNGKPVIFVYNASANDNTCAFADKWVQANTGIGFYIDLKVFSGYTSCPNQPDSWHQYAPAGAADSQAGYSYAIGPGFKRADEPTARLARDPARWAQNVTDMAASNAPWKLITTFNEWGEGTATEAAKEWNSASGFGTYLDELHNK